jgi:ATP-dependent DNA helicase PIF1
MRLSRSTSEEIEFANWLLDVGHGTNICPDGTISFNIDMQVHNRDALINETYPNIDNVIPPPLYFLDRLLLAPTNEEVNDLNMSILNHFPGEESIFYSVDSVEPEPGVNWDTEYIPPEYLHCLNASGLPPGELRLKTGCPLILLRNLTPSRGLCNGTRLTLQHATGRVLEVKIMGGQHDGQITFIPRISLFPSSQPGMTFRLCRRQFPVCLAFALTINKAQGQSVRHVGIDLRKPVFSHGQLYVALSRATSRNRVKLLLPPSQSEPRLRNVVYPEIFQMLRGAN